VRFVEGRPGFYGADVTQAYYRPVDLVVASVGVAGAIIIVVAGGGGGWRCCHGVFRDSTGGNSVWNYFFKVVWRMVVPEVIGNW